MNIDIVLKAMRIACEVSYNNFVTPHGTFKTSGLMILADQHKVSVFKNTKLVWATTDEFDIRRVRTIGHMKRVGEIR
jgi:hypothetical protein